MAAKDATSVGSACVTLMPSMDGFAGKICSEFGSTGAKAGKDFGDGMSDGVKGGTEASEGLMSKLGGVATATAAAAAKGFAALTSAVTGIGGAALAAYADYEQLVGGVDTLFGDASGTLQQYAADAYESCGLSANQYMTQATSFAASLVSSCGGDTARAAEYANMAMGDMSDNVNKMGSNMVDVQNAYQGFAKQNYTMLDNLKLGYGGTQEEMKRLISDANELRAAQGLNADLTIDSYADVVEAIHTVQENMGITGTTAKEAATTISGSVGMAKASWENFLTALGRDDVDFSLITQQLLESIGAVATNVAPRVAQIGQGIINAFPAVLAGLGTVLAPIVSEALSTAWNIAANALAGIGIKLPSVDSSQMLSAISGAMEMAKLALTDPAAFMERGSEIVQSVASGLSTAIPQLVSSGLDAIGQFASGFRTMFPQVIQIGGEMLLGIVQGLAASLPSLIEKGPQIISDFANGISAAAETLLGIGLQIIVAIGQGLVTAIPTFIANIPAIAQAAWDAFVAFQWLNLGATIVKSIASGIASLGSQIPSKLNGFLDQGISHATSFVTSMATKATEAGSKFLQNVSSYVSQLPGKLSGWISNMVSKAADFSANLATKATEAGSRFLQNVSGSISQLPGKLSGWISNMVSNAGRFASDMASKALSAGSQFLSNVSTHISQLPGKIAGWFDEMVLKALGFAFDMAVEAASAGSRFLSGISDGFSRAVGFVSGIPGQMLGALGDVGGLLWNSGWSLISGFTDGIQSCIGNAIDAVASGISEIRSYFPFSPAKKGPFSGHGYTLYSGEALMTDWGRGMEAGAGAAQSAIASAMDGANGLLASGATVSSGSVTVSSDAARGAESDALGAIVSLLESIRDKDGSVYLDADKVSSALASRSRYAMAGRGVA